MFYKEDLIRHIRQLGIHPTDTVMVHTSLKSLGQIHPEDKTTAEVFIYALRACLPDGLLLIPTHTWANIREDGDVFSLRDTIPCIGAVPTVAAQLAAKAWDAGDRTCVRSLHPTHSVVAFGKRAAEYVADDAKAVTPAPVSGSFGKLYTENAKILLVGVSHARNTYFHAVDEYLDIPDRLQSQPTRLLLRDYDGTVTERSITRHLRSMSHFFDNYEPYLEHCGAMRFGRLGDALVRVCDAQPCAHAIERLWKNADHDLCAAYERLPFPKGEEENHG